MTNTERTNIEEHANLLYSVYCEAVGGVAFNGDPLPSWEDFAADPKKQLQADAWRSVAKQSRELETALADARASASTYREQYEASEMNIKNLMHYAKGLPDHVSISSPAIPIRDALTLLHADKADIETKWEELCKAIGAHGPESDPLTGNDTNDTIHARAMERIREMVSDDF